MIQIITKGKICMNREEKNIVIGGIVVSVLATSGFTLSQGPIGDADDNYNSNSEDIIIAYNDEFDMQELQLKEYGVIEETSQEVAKDTIEDIKVDYIHQDIIEENINEEITIDEEVIENNDAFTILLEKDGYFTLNTLKSYYADNGVFFKEKTYIRQLPAIMQQLNLEKIKASKKIKEQYGILSAGFPYLFRKKS